MNFDKIHVPKNKNERKFYWAKWHCPVDKINFELNVVQRLFKTPQGLTFTINYDCNHVKNIRAFYETENNNDHEDMLGNTTVRSRST